ncbi:MAG: hypothetical protein H6541_10505 [Lentimicrobiaceae bacterium]|nr:hypothetical protein [Lentimicrobiaceae bacterium]MCB9024252.1 hypothetical protein [Lentimicrobiaceae bacterium]MCO5265250.1 nitrophenyl compound nitroreductase subunit ArsF family protein [Lentimicrobium sp.]
MKNLSFFGVLLICISLISCNNSGVKTEGDAMATVKDRAGVQVYYFHYSRRCATCNAVEDVTRSVLDEFYPDKLKNGEISFQSINLEEKDGEELGNRLKIAGQALIILKDTLQTDLTEPGFMYALSEPDKLKAEIKSTIDAALK